MLAGLWKPPFAHLYELLEDRGPLSVAQKDFSQSDGTKRVKDSLVLSQQCPQELHQL